MDVLTPIPRPTKGRKALHLRRRALVVEMDRATQSLCQKVLARDGFTVDVADTGVEALQAARKKTPTVILMDLQLRDALGLDVVNWMRSDPNLCDVPVIGISAVAEDAWRLWANGIATVLRKPLSPAAVERAVREALK